MTTLYKNNESFEVPEKNVVESLIANKINFKHATRHLLESMTPFEMAKTLLQQQETILALQENLLEKEKSDD
ncbi:hypothetical protein KUA24_157 [Vibrio phage HNL01]|nr:hypothetical protein KUA24_157 [Vibrio phage HNL01]